MFHILCQHKSLYYITDIIDHVQCIMAKILNVFVIIIKSNQNDIKFLNLAE